MSGPLRVYPRPPATSDIVGTLVQVRQKAEPELVALLDDEDESHLQVSLHIQDGVVNHIKVASETVLDLSGEKSTWERPDKPAEVRAADLMKSALANLRGRLSLSLVSGYHGTVTMSFDVKEQRCRLFSCRSEQTHRVQSGRVPT